MSRKAIVASALLLLTTLAAGAGCQLDWSLDATAADGGALDAASGDGQVAADGGGDAGLDCTGALLCTDFSNGMTVPPFGQTFIGPGGTFRVDLDGGASPHDSTLYVVRPSTTQSQDSAYAQTPIYTQTFTQASLAVDVLPVQVDSSTAHACVLGIGFNDSLASEHVIRLMVGTSSSNIQDKYPTGVTSHDLVGNLTIGQWSRVALSVTIGGHVTVTLDGASALDVEIGSLGASSSATKAFIGINFTEDSTKSYAFRFDNVRLDAN